MGRRSAAAGGGGRLAGARHELLVKVAVGGTSTVFVGRERGKSELVAIKRMHPYLASDESARVQMLREASIAGRVRHDHLVHIRGVEESGEELLLVMDYVEGGSLAELLSVGALPLGAGLRIILDAASGLTALHEVSDPDTGRRLGFVHRDISPQNILVGLDGRARLGDFGLVKRTDVSTTHTTVVRGKVAYMAPEQIEGQRARQAADVYAMGVVLWEVVSGERLFRGMNDADTMRRVLVGAVPALADRGHPDALDAVVRRCLARDPKARFPHVNELTTAIESAAEGIALASRADIAALVNDALGDALQRRRETVEASANAETTATGDVDIDAILASGRASAELAQIPTAPLPEGAPGELVESDPLPFSEEATISLHDEETFAVGSESRAPDPSPSAARSPSSSRTIVVAVVAALAGASVSWLVTRAPTDPEPAVGTAEEPTPTEATVRSAPAALEAARAETTSTSPPATTASGGVPVDATPDEEETGAVEADTTPRPRPRPSPAKPSVPPAHTGSGTKSGKTEGKKKAGEVSVPENPYR